MSTQEERERAAEIEAKLSSGVPLEEEEEVFWAYSRFGSASTHGY